MLTEQQLAILRSAPSTNRVAKAISVAGVTQVTVADAVGLPQPYVSDVARQRYPTITVENARKFADYWAHSRFPGHVLTPTGVMAIRCKQFHLPDL